MSTGQRIVHYEEQRQDGFRAARIGHFAARNENFVVGPEGVGRVHYSSRKEVHADMATDCHHVVTHLDILDHGMQMFVKAKAAVV